MIIDKRGRLFGRINIIDFLVILFIFSLLPMVYFGYKILNQPPPPLPPPPLPVYAAVPVEVYCNFEGVDKKAVDLISVGDQEMDRNGKIIGEVLDIIKKKDYISRYDIGNNSIVEIKDPNKSQVLVKLQILTEVKGNSIFYKGAKIAINSTITFTTHEYSISGNISLFMDWQEIRVKFDNMLTNTARLLKKGDIEVDRDGAAIGKIKEVFKMEAAKQVVFLQNEGVYKYVNYPGRRDAELSFNVLAEKRKDGIYYKNVRLSAGRGFTFQTDGYYISGTIVGMGSF